MLKRVVLVAGVCMALGAGGSPAQAAELTKCRQGALCGELVVPLDRTGATPGTITIRFVLYPRTDRSRPALDTIVAAEGGPGYSTTGSAEYYLELFAPLRDRRDLLLVDQRGTGESHPIKCPAAQSYLGDLVRNAQICGASLGARADLHTTADAADDLAAVLDALAIERISLYGDSYGSFFAQSFAVRHSAYVRALVLDATYPVAGLDPWYRTIERSLMRNLANVCARSQRSCPVPAPQMAALTGRLLEQIRRHPIVGTAPDARGKEVRVRVTPDSLMTTLLSADVVPAVHREFPAAAVAALAGNERPLLRLVGEEITYYSAGAYQNFSEGAYLAYACNDYPQLWDPMAAFSRRAAQFQASIGALAPGTFAPWTNAEWAASSFMVYDYCLRWPKPAVARPPIPVGAAYPALPVLVLNGDLDLRTDVPQAQEVAGNFPNSTFVVVPNMGHVTALFDADACAAAIVRRFVSTLSAGSTSCTARIPEHRVVARFSPTVAGLAPAVVASGGDQSTVADRRAATAAMESVADVIDRWYAIPGFTGVGLYGGTFSMYTTSGTPFVSRVWSLRLQGLRWTSDLAVSGSGKVPRGAGTATMGLKLRGAAGGVVKLRWQTREPGADVHITGTINGHRVDLTAPAPSFW